MKSRLNITIDETLMQQAKRYAARHRISVSQLVEQFFRTLARPSRKKNILELLNELPPPGIKKSENDLKKSYYDKRKEKYGF